MCKNYPKYTLMCSTNAWFNVLNITRSPANFRAVSNSIFSQGTDNTNFIFDEYHSCHYYTQLCKHTLITYCLLTEILTFRYIFLWEIKYVTIYLDWESYMVMINYTKFYDRICHTRYMLVKTINKKSIFKYFQFDFYSINYYKKETRKKHKFSVSKKSQS